MKRLAPFALLLLLLAPARAQEASDYTPDADPIEVQPADDDEPTSCDAKQSATSCLDDMLMSVTTICCSSCVRFAPPSTCVFVYHCNVGC